MKKSLIYILLLFCTCLQAADFAPYKIKGQFIGGWIYPHDASIIKPLTKGPVLGCEIAFELASDGSKQWQKDFNMPDLGFALQVLDLGNPEITGQMISLYPYINIPMVNSEKIRFNAKMGMGAAFATKPCDLDAAIADPRAIKQKAAEYNFAIGGDDTHTDFHAVDAAPVDGQGTGPVHGTGADDIGIHQPEVLPGLGQSQQIL